MKMHGFSVGSLEYVDRSVTCSPESTLEVSLSRATHNRDSFGKLVTTAVLLIFALWGAIYLLGYPVFTALFLAWISSGVLIPVFIHIRFRLSDAYPSGEHKTGFLNNRTVGQATQSTRQ